jgi:hypothetical protein
MQHGPIAWIDVCVCMSILMCVCGLSLPKPKSLVCAA